MLGTICAFDDVACRPQALTCLAGSYVTSEATLTCCACALGFRLERIANCANPRRFVQLDIIVLA